MLALWLPASNHCRLEPLPGLAFLACCDHQEEATAHHDGDCDTDGCAAVESGFYKTTSGRIQPPTPILLTATLLTVLPDETRVLPVSCLSHSTAAPPDNSGGWQFAFRTALPPRAPSLIS